MLEGWYDDAASYMGPAFDLTAEITGISSDGKWEFKGISGHSNPTNYHGTCTQATCKQINWT
ncbi:hypothetical protein EJK17_07885 [Lactobacillus xujianguonis]|uniref:Uncharacterized protein n=1 Tax=Lactobacillus xujianguonis TaxID=2495899 RepID=A0A437SU82_9LACO|nr:hypothetical protein [Lactobacillus xujianguonis]RVU70422.1 hypothetical protein EJK17_07885 [Lactobacillus xujianguonis]